MTDTRPNLYMDIDGVLLANEANLAPGAVELIKYAADNFTVYWLTTHCMNGDPAHAIDYVQRASREDLRPYLEKFRPTSWSLAKTEAIDFAQPFLWFDDDCYSGERAKLRENGVFHSWIEIDLNKYPVQLFEEMKLLEAIVNETM